PNGREPRPRSQKHRAGGEKHRTPRARDSVAGRHASAARRDDPFAASDRAKANRPAGEYPGARFAKSKQLTVCSEPYFTALIRPYFSGSVRVACRRTELVHIALRAPHRKTHRASRLPSCPGGTSRRMLRHERRPGGE